MSYWVWALGYSSEAAQPDRAQDRRRQFNLTDLQENWKITSMNSQVMVRRWHFRGGVSCGTRQRKIVCACVSASYLMHEHEGAGWRGGEAHRQPACGLKRRRWRKRRTGLASETLPFHRTSFPLVTSTSPLRLNLPRPHRGRGGLDADYYQHSTRIM